MADKAASAGTVRIALPVPPSVSVSLPFTALSVDMSAGSPRELAAGASR